MVNETIILGTLGKDSEVRSANGQFVISYSIASSLKWKSGEEWKEKTFWTECDQWFKNEQSANKLSDALRKGSKVIVQGFSYPRAWIKDGTAMATQCLRVDKLEIVHSTKPKNENQGSNAAPPLDYNSNADDDDLPF